MGVFLPAQSGAAVPLATLPDTRPVWGLAFHMALWMLWKQLVSMA